MDNLFFYHRSTEKEALLSALAEADHVWVVAHSPQTSSALLREILSFYMPKHRIEIKRSLAGKPFIEAVDGLSISFSISHSRHLWMAVVSLDEAVGIDVEYVAKRQFLERIAKRYFSEREQEQTVYGYYRSWTAREAFVKTLGSGLMKIMSHIHIEQEGEDVIIGGKENMHYRVSFLEPFVDFVAAVCRVRHSTKKLRCYYHNSR